MLLQIYKTYSEKGTAHQTFWKFLEENLSISIYIYTYNYICTYEYTCMYTYVYIYRQIYIYIHTYIGNVHQPLWKVLEEKQSFKRIMHIQLHQVDSGNYSKLVYLFINVYAYLHINILFLQMNVCAIFANEYICITLVFMHLFPYSFIFIYIDVYRKVNI
jgi:hypothetical protein